jgi:hypothetical protein
MTAEDPDWPGEKAAEDRTVMPAGTGPADDADSPARRRPTAAASQYRLKRLRDEHPDVEIVARGYWQAVIPRQAGKRSSPDGISATCSTSSMTYTPQQPRPARRPRASPREHIRERPFRPSVTQDIMKRSQHFDEVVIPTLRKDSGTAMRFARSQDRT